MCEAETLQRIHQVTSGLSESAARQVLAFAEYLESYCPLSKTLSSEEENKLIAELRGRAEARPMAPDSAGDFVRKIRDEARY